MKKVINLTNRAVCRFGLFMFFQLISIYSVFNPEESRRILADSLVEDGFDFTKLR